MSTLCASTFLLFSIPWVPLLPKFENCFVSTLFLWNVLDEVNQYSSGVCEKMYLIKTNNCNKLSPEALKADNMLSHYGWLYKLPFEVACDKL